MSHAAKTSKVVDTTPERRHGRSPSLPAGAKYPVSGDSRTVPALRQPGAPTYLGSHVGNRAMARAHGRAGMVGSPDLWRTVADTADALSAVRILQRQTSGNLDPDCEDLLTQIIARIAELAARADALIRDPLGLPPSGPMSVEGHQQQFQNKQQNLRRMLNQWDTNNCGPGYLPENAWRWATRPVPRPAPRPTSERTREEPPRAGPDIDAKDVAVAAGATAGAVAIGYLAYRAVRLLPSLLPPLWWTLPANVAVP